MNRGLRRGVQICLTLACFVALWRLGDGEAALRHLVDAQPIWIGAALVALTLQTLLSALRWQLTASRLGIALERGTAVREYYLSQVVNQTLPGGVLGDAGRAYRARSQVGFALSGLSVVFERLTGQMALLLVFAVGLIAAWWMPGDVKVPGWALLPVFLIPALAALAVRAARNRLPPLVGRVFRSFEHAVAAREVRIKQAALSFGTAVCNIAAFLCCAIAVELPLSVSAALVLVPLVLLSMLVPLTVSGWGLREGAAAALLPLAGGSVSAALAASVAFGFAVLLATLPGLVVLGLNAAPDPVGS